MENRFMYEWNDKLHEECGVFGIWSMDDINAAQWIYYGLVALQHRGQESLCAIRKDPLEIFVHIKGWDLSARYFMQKN